MPQPLFDVFFRGALLPDADADQVRERLAALFGLGPAELGRLFGGAPVSAIAMEKPKSTEAAVKAWTDWPDDEKLAYEKETLGFYISGHPLNKFAEELKLFANASTENLWQKVDQTVNIGGIVGQLKKNKIKKGPNEGKLMAKFVLDDQFGSVDVVFFADMYAKVARWLENGVAVFMTAAVKDTGGVQGGRSASLASAEQPSGAAAGRPHRDAPRRIARESGRGAPREACVMRWLT